MPGRRAQVAVVDVSELPALDTWEEVCRAVGASTTGLFAASSGSGQRRVAKGVDLDRPHRIRRLAGLIDWEELDFASGAAAKRPQRIGDFSIKHTIGRGLGGGAVFMAVHAYTSAKVAVKWPLPAEELHLWRRLLERLPSGCPGVPLLHAAGEHEGAAYAVTELLGADLTKVIKRFDPTDWQRRWRAARVFGRMLLRRLEAFHRAGFVHCDVSPYNILLGRAVGSSEDDVAPYLIDFGLSRCWPGAGPLGAEHSTAEFASVRAAEGIERRPVDDLEALAWTLLWLVFGDLPWCAWQFEGLAPLELVARIRAAKLRLLRGGSAVSRAAAPSWSRLDETPAQLRDFLAACDSTVERPNPLDYQFLAGLLGGRPGLTQEEAEQEDLREFRGHVWPML